MSRYDQIRQSVLRAYTDILADKTTSEHAETSRIAALADYDKESLTHVNDDALQNSFGCGNPPAFASVAQGDTVLDLGCGAGIDLLIAADRVGPEGWVIGIDMTNAMLDKARANIAHSAFNNIAVQVGIIEALPLETASVDGEKTSDYSSLRHRKT